MPRVRAGHPLSLLVWPTGPPGRAAEPPPTDGAGGGGPPAYAILGHQSASGGLRENRCHDRGRTPIVNSQSRRQRKTSPRAALAARQRPHGTWNGWPVPDRSPTPARPGHRRPGQIFAAVTVTGAGDWSVPAATVPSSRAVASAVVPAARCVRWGPRKGPASSTSIDRPKGNGLLDVRSHPGRPRAGSLNRAHGQRGPGPGRGDHGGRPAHGAGFASPRPQCGLGGAADPGVRHSARDQDVFTGGWAIAGAPTVVARPHTKGPRQSARPCFTVARANGPALIAGGSDNIGQDPGARRPRARGQRTPRRGRKGIWQVGGGPGGPKGYPAGLDLQVNGGHDPGPGQRPGPGRAGPLGAHGVQPADQAWLRQWPRAGWPALGRRYHRTLVAPAAPGWSGTSIRERRNSQIRTPPASQGARVGAGRLGTRDGRETSPAWSPEQAGWPPAHQTGTGTFIVGGPVRRRAAPIRRPPGTRAALTGWPAAGRRSTAAQPAGLAHADCAAVSRPRASCHGASIAGIYLR